MKEVTGSGSFRAFAMMPLARDSAPSRCSGSVGGGRARPSHDRALGEPGLGPAELRPVSVWFRY